MAYEILDRTLSRQGFPTSEEKYKRCRFLNVIQHIDIYAKCKQNYSEPSTRSWRTDKSSFVTSTSNSPTKMEYRTDSSGTNIESKLSRLSITTKVSGLYPGHDILSKRARKNKQFPREVVYNSFIPR